MGTYTEFIEMMDRYLINGMFVSVIVIILTRAIVKNAIDTQSPVVIIKWIIIGYSALRLLSYVVTLSTLLKSAAFSTGLVIASGPYWYISWLMLLSNTIFPLLLLFKRLQHRIYFILVLSLLMRIGLLFEFAITYMTSTGRDYTPSSWLIINESGGMIIFKGAVLGFLLLAVCNILKWVAKRIGNTHIVK